MRRLEWKAGAGDGGHPTATEVAAYIDGHLASGARRRIAEHLTSCDDCFELYTGTLDCLGEIRGKLPGGNVVQFPSRAAVVKRWLPAAAAAVLLVALGIGGYRAFCGRPEMEVADLVQTLRGSDELVDKVWTGETLRGSADGQHTDDSAVSFLVGAHLVGFQASIEAVDLEAASDAAGRVASVLAHGEQVRDARRAFGQAVVGLRRAHSVAPYARLVEETSPAIEGAFEAVHLDFGKWAQAGHIAALTHSQRFFDARANYRFLVWMLDQDDEDIDLDAERYLHEVEGIWRRYRESGGTLSAVQLDHLAAAFTSILDRYEALARPSSSF